MKLPVIPADFGATSRMDESLHTHEATPPTSDSPKHHHQCQPTTPTHERTERKQKAHQCPALSDSSRTQDPLHPHRGTLNGPQLRPTQWQSSQRLPGGMSPVHPLMRTQEFEVRMAHTPCTTREICGLCTTREICGFLFSPPLV
jgi:hypothetical protein